VLLLIISTFTVKITICTHQGLVLPQKGSPRNEKGHFDHLIRHQRHRTPQGITREPLFCERRWMNCHRTRKTWKMEKKNIVNFISAKRLLNSRALRARTRRKGGERLSTHDLLGNRMDKRSYVHVQQRKRVTSK
jgi:hypothetical protein